MRPTVYMYWYPDGRAATGGELCCAFLVVAVSCSGRIITCHERFGPRLWFGHGFDDGHVDGELS